MCALHGTILTVSCYCQCLCVCVCVCMHLCVWKGSEFGLESTDHCRLWDFAGSHENMKMRTKC